MGDNSCLKGRGFESLHHMLDGHFYALICCKNCIVCLKRAKLNVKRPGLAHLLNLIKLQSFLSPSLEQNANLM